MPQMAPLWWETLYMMFIMSFMMVNIMMYFTIKNDFKSKKKEKKMFINMNWTW
uniref:ATP synthase F0 subunit 8 n=1 Tax=Brachymna tenuis TaxID=2575665 RepID=A0A4D6X052_9HEMI|nr:ATP synthase F0 subunit 8 [Brachymna tenuis]QCI09264.1 ATP synthase F0 subunit 8 [Brachymna tenuis]